MRTALCIHGAETGAISSSAVNGENRHRPETAPGRSVRKRRRSNDRRRFSWDIVPRGTVSFIERPSFFPPLLAAAKALLFPSASGSADKTRWNGRRRRRAATSRRRRGRDRRRARKLSATACCGIPCRVRAEILPPKRRSAPFSQTEVSPASKGSGPSLSMPVQSFSPFCSSQKRPKRRRSAKRSCRRPLSEKTARVCFSAGNSGGTTSSRPVMRRCNTISAPSSRKKRRNLPRRPIPVTARPVTSSTKSSGAGWAITSRRSSATFSMRRPRICGAVTFFTISTSGSSGMIGPPVLPVPCFPGPTREYARALFVPFEKSLRF